MKNYIFLLSALVAPSLFADGILDEATAGTPPKGVPITVSVAPSPTPTPTGDIFSQVAGVNAPTNGTPSLAQGAHRDGGPTAAALADPAGSAAVIQPPPQPAPTNQSTSDNQLGDAKLEVVGDPVIVGPSFIEGWEVVPADGWKFRAPVQVTLANSRTYAYTQIPYLLVPKDGRVVINPKILPVVNEIIRNQRALLKTLNAQLSDSSTVYTPVAK